MSDNMKYCTECGTKLIEKELEKEGVIPYCPNCMQFRFPTFSTAVSIIVTDPKKEKILLIKQYGRPDYVLVAGYVNKGEDAEDTVRREAFEELKLKVREVHFNRSHYFAPSNTLMLNFVCTVEGSLTPTLDDEVDEYHWFTFEQARQNIKPNSLAKAFLVGYLDGTYNF